MDEEIRWELAPVPSPLKAYLLPPAADPILVISSEIPMAERVPAAASLFRVAAERRARLDMIARLSDS